MADSNLKIALVGLENAGKTSIIRTLNRTYNINGKIAPTKSVERTTFTLFSQEGSIWDYAGQLEYRQSYLQNPERYLSEIQFLFFVIDIQDSSRFSKAFEYFEQMYNYIHRENPKVIVAILFHKADPKLYENSQIPQNIEELSLRFQHIVENNEISFYHTSIFDPISLLNSMSLPILGSQPVYNIISMILAEFAMDHSIEYISVLVNELLELGSFRLKTPKESFIQASLNFYHQISNKNSKFKPGEYELKGYKFVIINRNVLDYNYCLNYAHPTTEDAKPPSKEELRQLFGIINEKIEEYNPTLI
ncbi:ADP-ribosylation factor-like protein [Candidatus Harpocratesius sp.]